ncbi:MAG: riboflavin synthase [Gammaproteobacteria bacterium]
MFTGIIVDTGIIRLSRDAGGDRRIEIAPGNLSASDMIPGASIAVNGVCLTVTDTAAEHFACDVSRETLWVTTLKDLARGDAVNLEPALKLGAELGGHLVTGHVDGVGTIAKRASDARSVRLEIRAPEALMGLIAAKGSIAVDGVSLTVNDVRGVVFGVNIVPHTLTATVIGNYRVAGKVNLEADLLARYTDRWLSTRDHENR